MNEGALVLAYLSRLLGNGSSIRELANELSWFCLTADGSLERQRDRAEAGRLMRLLRLRRAKRAVRVFEALDALLNGETRRLHLLRMTNLQGRTPAVFPLAAIWIEPG